MRAEGTKELIALANGFRESSESWRTSCAMPNAAAAARVLAIGDGALGFWAALRDAFPTTREQRCWFHKTGNVLSALPKSAQTGAKKALNEITGAANRPDAEKAARAFERDYGAKWPKGDGEDSPASGRHPHRRPGRAPAVL